MGTEKFSIINTTKGKLPRLPFVLYKNKILGKKYELSLTFIGEKKIQSLNRIYRNKNTPTDILSFSIEKDLGEIFICLKVAKKRSVEFQREYKNFISFLFIHSAVHLLGYDHGEPMEKIEKKYRKHFKI
jgi:probable rRNA maturation factor